VKRGGYQAPAGELSGYKTLVTDTSSKGLPSTTSKDPEQDYRDRPNVPSNGGYKKQVMPVTPKHEKRRDKHQPMPDEPSRRPVYNGPGPSGGPSGDEKTVHKDKMRTKSEPGEEYGHPYINDGPAGVKKRRTQGPSASVTAGGKRRMSVLPKQRQRRQLQPKRKQDKMRNRRLRMRMKPYNRRRWRRIRRLPIEKRQRKKRKDPRFKNRFKRIPGGGFSTGAERARAWREKNKTASSGFRFLHLESDEEGRLWRVSPEGTAIYEFDGTLDSVDVDVLLDEVVFAVDQADDVVAYLDAVLGEDPMEDEVLDVLSPVARVAAKYNIQVRYRPRKRMKRMRGKALQRRKRQYRLNKAKERRNAKKRRGRLKNRAGWKKQQRIRRQNPKVFKKRMGQVLTAPEIAFVMGERMDLGYVHGISPMTGLVVYHRRYGNDFEAEALPVPDFMASVAFLTDQDIDAMFELIDVELGPEAHMAEPQLSITAVRNSAGLENIDCDGKDFQDECEKLVGKRKLEEMSPSELAQVDASLIQRFTYDKGDPVEFPHDDDEEGREGDEMLTGPSAHPQVYGRVTIPPDDEAQGKTAEMLYEKVQPHDVDTWHDRGQGWTKKKQRQQERETPTENSYPYGFVDNNPGSAKVIPEWHDLANKAERVLKQADLDYERLPFDKKRLLYKLIKSPEWDRFRRGGPVSHADLAEWMTEHGWSMTERGFGNLIQQAYRTAALISDIEGGTDTRIHDRAGGLRPKLKRVDVRLGMWTYQVPGSNGPHTVKVKATRSGSKRNVNKLDVYVKCSCPFWQWQGPEYHAKQGGYLFGKPRGTASEPAVKDPENRHGACKHVLAVLAAIKGLGPLRKEWGKRGSAERVSARYLADTFNNSEIRILSVQRVAARYREGQRLHREE
jgi:hypothetical protein